MWCSRASFVQMRPWVFFLMALREKWGEISRLQPILPYTNNEKNLVFSSLSLRRSLQGLPPWGPQEWIRHTWFRSWKHSINIASTLAPTPSSACSIFGLVCRCKTVRFFPLTKRPLLRWPALILVYSTKKRKYVASKTELPYENCRKFVDPHRCQQRSQKNSIAAKRIRSALKSWRREPLWSRCGSGWFGIRLGPKSLQSLWMSFLWNSTCR